MDEVHHGMQLVGLDAKTSTLECNMSRDMHAERVWAARYNTWLLIKLSPKGVVFSFLFFSSQSAYRDQVVWRTHSL